MISASPRRVKKLGVFVYILFRYLKAIRSDYTGSYGEHGSYMTSVRASKGQEKTSPHSATVLCDTGQGS